MSVFQYEGGGIESSRPFNFMSCIVLDWSYQGRSATGICLVCDNVLERRGTVHPVSSSILTTSSLSPKCTIMVITGTGPLLGKGKDSEDLTLKCLEAFLFKRPPSLSWPSLESSSSALDRDRFLVMAMVCSPVVMYKSLPTGRSDSRENLACRCRGFPNQTLPSRPFSRWLRFLLLSLV